MRRTLVILCLLAGLAAAPVVSYAQAGISAPQELFVGAFLSDRKGEELATAGNSKGAIQAYREAADSLSQIKQQFPNWQKDLVDFRLSRVNKAIAELQAKAPAMKPGDTTPEPPMPNVEDASNAILPPIAGSNRPSPLPPPPTSPQDPLDTKDPLQPPDGALNPGRNPAPIKNGNSGHSSKPAPAPSGDPVAEISKKIEGLETENSALKTTIEETRNVVKESTLAVEAAKKDKEKALADKKEATDLLNVVTREYHDLKNKKDGNEDRVKELEAKMVKMEKDQAASNAELVAADERLKQLLSRTKATVIRLKDAGTFPAQIKKLEAELADEKSARATLEQKLVGVTKERDDARLELVKLKDANKDADKLMADNANLLKKLADTETQIKQFKEDLPKKDAEIALLKKQMTDGQKALAASQEKNAALQTEIGTLKKKMDDYSKQLADSKSEKAVSVEERRKLEDENKLLQGIVMRVLQEDANRSQRKKMVQKEMERLQIQSDVLLKQISFLTEPVIKLTNAERRLFKNPVVNMQSPNDLMLLLPPKPEGDAPKGAKPGEASSADVKPVPATPTAGADPLPTPDPEKPDKTPTAPPPAKPLEVASANPTKTPDLPVSDAPPAEPSNVPNAGKSAEGFQGLPPEVKPLAEQAKKAFESENYGEAEKIYEKAKLIAPNNLYVVSNLGVTQFRSKKYKNAEESFRRAITIAPEDHFSWCTLGIVQYSQGKFDDAVTSLTKSIAINSKNATAHNYLGITAAQKGWIEHARKELETAIQLNPKYEDAYFNLAVTYTLQKPPSLEEARKAYKKALELGAEPDPDMENTLKGEGAVESEPKAPAPQANR